ncbi:MAG: hypothetical protein CHACPFDD_01078 [Phycisphaerae bacterium]|nr:hypothetical protein [Phycisphaerae bacterium]
MVSRGFAAFAGGAVRVAIAANRWVAVLVSEDHFLARVPAPHVLPCRLVRTIPHLNRPTPTVPIEVHGRIPAVVGVDLDAAVRDDLADAAVGAVVGVRRERGLRRAAGVAALDADQAIPGVVDELEDAVVGQTAVIVIRQGGCVRREVVVDHQRVGGVVQVEVGVQVKSDLHVVEVLNRRAGDVAVEQAGVAGGPVVVDRGRVEQGGLVAPGVGGAGVLARQPSVSILLAGWKPTPPQPLQGGVSEIVTHDHLTSIPIPVRQGHRAAGRERALQDAVVDALVHPGLAVGGFDDGRQPVARIHPADQKAGRRTSISSGTNVPDAIQPNRVTRPIKSLTRLTQVANRWHSSTLCR